MMLTAIVERMARIVMKKGYEVKLLVHRYRPWSVAFKSLPIYGSFFYPLNTIEVAEMHQVVCEPKIGLDALVGSNNRLSSIAAYFGLFRTVCPDLPRTCIPVTGRINGALSTFNVSDFVNSPEITQRRGECRHHCSAPSASISQTNSSDAIIAFTAGPARATRSSYFASEGMRSN